MNKIMDDTARSPLFRERFPQRRAVASLAHSGHASQQISQHVAIESAIPVQRI
ncbi:hypothetical protein SSAG_02547 [Streptomyces sp. Mg1]|nr:hypothetical protein SSAG_02547 [Streptomyces sp. Mg1]